jgi:hypothetical protein
MGFSKTGAIFKIAESRVSCLNEWEEFKKIASSDSTCKVIEKETEVKKDAIEKQSDFDVIAAVDPEKFIYIHTTIMAGVKTASNGYWITPETEKFINDNHDSWECDDLVNDYPTFKRALTFVEHVQDLEKAKGKCIDAIARKMPDTVLVDVLFSVDKKHADLVDNIKNGIINAVSMGCSTEKTVCSICGNIAKDQTQYCHHIKNQKGQMVKCADGKMRRAAEICKNNTFFDVSLVANPAFAGAVFRKILSTEELGTHVLANLISNKIESFTKNGDTFLKAASSENPLEIIIKKDGQINVKSNSNNIQEKLPDEELSSIRSIFTNETHATKFLSKIINKFFNKNSGYHPILNTTTANDNYTISDEDHTPIPTSIRHEIIRSETEKQTDLRLREPPIESATTSCTPNTVQRLPEFECYQCGHKEELWQIKASSLDSGYKNALVCPECCFISETEKNIKKSFKLTTVDKIQLGDLGFSASDVKKLKPDQITIILSKDITKQMFEKDPNIGIKRAEVTHSILKALKEDGRLGEFLEQIEQLKEGQVVVAASDIPVDNDEGVLHFEESGSSVITKNEKLTFIGSVENGEYGFFKTQDGEEFFMPTSCYKKKVG